MELSVQCFGDKDFVIEVGEDDTTATMRQKVASAAGLAEDSFHMGFGGKDEGEDITELSAGDKVVLKKTTKYEAIAALHALGETDVTSEKLKEVTDLKVASLLLQAEVVTAIPGGFLRSSAVTCVGSSGVSIVDDIRDTSLPHCDTELDLPNLPFITAIGDLVLENCTALSTVDLTGLKAVTSIGNGFLAKCRTLSRIDFRGMNEVTSIGNGFLCGCVRLSNIDLRGMKAVTSIGNGFLFICPALSSVDLTGMKRVTSFGSSFLANCTRLSKVDLTGMKEVTSIGSGFLASCATLSTVDLSGMTAVTSIGDGVLADCTMLASIDITGMKAVTSIGRYFLDNCKSLQTAHGMNDCSDVIRRRVQEVPTLTN